MLQMDHSIVMSVRRTRSARSENLNKRHALAVLRFLSSYNTPTAAAAQEP